MVNQPRDIPRKNNQKLLLELRPAR